MPEEPRRQDKDVQESEEKTPWDKIKGSFLANPTLALTLLYLYATGVGMIYSSALYESFGINIFDYSEIADFLFAALKDPGILLLGGLQVVMTIFVLELILNAPGSGRGGRLGLRVYVIVLALVAVSAVTPSVIATQTASNIKNGERSEVEVRYRSFSGTAGQVTVPGLVFIGATQKAVFFYDVDDKRTLVIPQTQLVSIEVPGQH